MVCGIALVLLPVYSTALDRFYNRIHHSLLGMGDGQSKSKCVLGHHLIEIPYSSVEDTRVDKLLNKLMDSSWKKGRPRFCLLTESL